MPDLGNGSVFSQTDASNNSGTMPSWSGSAAPSTLDDAGRAFQGAVTREWNWRSYTLTATGTADAKVLTFSVAPAAYYNGQRFSFIANTTNTTTATLNVNSLGAKSIRKMIAGTATVLAAGDMAAGAYVEVAYNTSGDYFVWLNRGLSSFPAGSASAPSIIPDGDTNTGFWFPAADTIAASTGGSERVRLDSSGRIGIGTTSPQKKLVVSDAGASGLEIDPFGRSGETATSLLSYNRSGGAFVAAHYDALNHQLYTSTTLRMSLDASGNFLNVSSGGIGYGAGSGGSVTQTTSRSTGVTINKTNGSITLFTAAGSATPTFFTVTNSTVAATDTIVLSFRDASNGYAASVTSVGAGSFNIAFYSISGTGSDTPKINFAVIKAVTS
jgi:hypothetical protein